MPRTILHSDGNNFYASVECLYNPTLRGKPVAVVGDPTQRHGIILAKSNEAKRLGIRTADTIANALKLCPNLTMVPPNYPHYHAFSKKMQDIYARYTDQVEPYGLDECFLDVSGSLKLYGSGEKIANRIRREVKEELGITVSVGVSFNKVFAKLGSDFQKPDATTVIDPSRWEEMVWPLPIQDLLYAGPSTCKKLKLLNIQTIGDLAATSLETLTRKLGKFGETLHRYANGQDKTEVKPYGAYVPPKSIGNSTTTARDLCDLADIKITLYILAESTCERLRAQGLECRQVQLSFRRPDMSWFQRQTTLPLPASNTRAVFEAALDLYLRYAKDSPIRSIGVRACDLSHWSYQQLSLLPEAIRSQKEDQLDCAIDRIRERFGFESIRRGIMLTDEDFSSLNPRTDHPNTLAGYIG